MKALTAEDAKDAEDNVWDANATDLTLEVVLDPADINRCTKLRVV